MQIVNNSFKRRFPKAPVNGFTRVAKEDQALAEGSTESYQSSLDRVRELKSSANKDFMISAGGKATFGLLAGLALTDFSPLGGALGAGLGVYIAWNRGPRKDNGQVRIELDGEKRTTSYHLKTTSYEKTPAEVRTEGMVDGRLGDQIAAYTPSAEEIPEQSPGLELAPHRKTLRQLAKQRKLVAPFGQKSKYGYETLNLVDAHMAGRLMAAERPVYVVAGESQDQEHTYKVSASNEHSTTRREISEKYVERTYNYSLKALEGTESLQQLPQGEGLPEGFTGVYENLNSLTQTVGSDEQNGFGWVGKDARKQTFKSRRIQRDAQLELGATNKTGVDRTYSLNVRDLITLAGVAAGMATGMGLSPGVPAAALVGGVLGGVAGREIGLFAQSKMPSHKYRSF